MVFDLRDDQASLPLHRRERRRLRSGKRGFEDLGNAVRKVMADLDGVAIRVRRAQDRLAQEPGRRPLFAYALGEIDYGTTRRAKSLREAELLQGGSPVDIRAYANINKDFPTDRRPINGLANHSSRAIGGSARSSCPKCSAGLPTAIPGLPGSSGAEEARGRRRTERWGSVGPLPRPQSHRACARRNRRGAGSGSSGGAAPACPAAGETARTGGHPGRSATCGGAAVGAAAGGFGLPPNSACRTRRGAASSRSGCFRPPSAPVGIDLVVVEDAAGLEEVAVGVEARDRFAQRPADGRDLLQLLGGRS